MQAEKLAASINRNFDLKFDDAAFADCQSFADAAKRIAELRTALSETDEESIRTRLSDFPGWRVRPATGSSRIGAYIPQSGEAEFWELLRRHMGVDTWPPLVAIPMLPKKQAAIMALLPPIIFGGVLYFTEEIVLASLIGVLITAYLIAFAIVRLKETTFELSPKGLTLDELVTRIAKRHFELEALKIQELSEQQIEAAYEAETPTVLTS